MAADGIRPNCGNPEQRDARPGRDQLRADARVREEPRRSTTSPSVTRSRSAGRRTSTRSTTRPTAPSALKGDPAPTLKAAPQLLPSVAGGHRRRGQPARRSAVINDGDAPLHASATAANVIQIQADAADGGNTTRRRLRDRQRDLLAARRSAPGARRAWSTSGFKPTRTNYVSVARVQFTSNADDAMERVLIAGQSTGDAMVTPSAATVPSRAVAELRRHRRRASARSSRPSPARYETAVAATVITHRRRRVAVGHRPEHAPLRATSTNGAFSLPQPLKVRARPTPRTRARRSRRWPRPPAPRRRC